jgi:hypothetical protein
MPNSRAFPAILRTSADTELTIFRLVLRSDMTRPLASRLYELLSWEMCVVLLENRRLTYPLRAAKMSSEN